MSSTVNPARFRVKIEWADGSVDSEYICETAYPEEGFLMIRFDGRRYRYIPATKIESVEVTELE